MTIKQKIVGNSLGSALLVATVGLLSAASMLRIGNVLRTLEVTEFRETRDADQVESAAAKIDQTIDNFRVAVQEHRETDAVRLKLDVDAAFGQINQAIARLEQIVRPQHTDIARSSNPNRDVRDARHQLELIKQRARSSRDVWSELRADMESNGNARSDSGSPGRVALATGILLRETLDFERGAKDDMMQGLQVAQDRLSTSMRVLTAAAVFAIILSLALGLLTAMPLAARLSRLRNGAVAVGKGNLEARIIVESADEIGQLATAFNEMAAGLRRSNDEIKENESKFRQSEAMLMRAQQVGNIGSWDWNPRSGELLWSDQYYRICRVDRREFTPTYEAALKRVYLEDRDRVKRALENALAGHERYCVEYRVIAGDQSVRVVLAQGDVDRDEIGNPVRMVGTALDITERKKAEQVLQRAYDELERRVSERTAELQRANGALLRNKVELQRAKETAEAASRAKSEFLANMSHEIRTPLNGVIGMSNLLLDTALDERQHRFAHLIKSSGESLSQLINDILDFAKIEARKLDIANVDFDLYAAVEDVIEMMLHKAGEKGLEIAGQMQSEVPRRVRGDPERVKQILVNLVNNAIKFTESGSVNTRLTVEERSQDHVTVRFSITDTGIGIPADRMHRLFKSFSQVDASTSRTYGGTGLGLAISKQLSELMGGSIGVESTSGRGSTFWFTVKLGLGSQVQVSIPKASPIATPPPTPPAETTQRVRILIAEDNRVNQIVASEMLAGRGYTCDIVDDGRKAVAAVSTGNYDLVLMDCSMPEMDGFEATRQIRRAEKADPAQTRPHMPIIALTANAINGDRERCLETGMDDYVSKPIDPHRLIQAIQTLLAKSRPASRAQPASEAATVTAATPSGIACGGEDPPLAIDALFDRCMGDAQTVSLILNEFEIQAVKDLAELKRHVESGDCEGTARVAHALKGASGILSADALSGIAFKLERMGHTGVLVEGDAFLTQLNDEVRRCIEYLPTARAAIAKRIEV